MLSGSGQNISSGGDGLHLASLSIQDSNGLALAKNDIRLLRLFSGPPESKIKCETFKATLSSHAPYEAVSYVWGDPNIVQPILLNGHKHMVTMNLHSFLLSRRDTNAELLLWIDALCINQNDADEKSVQVQLMKDIYGQASSLSIWLGSANESTSLAFQTLDNLVDNAFWRIGRDGVEEAILDILERPWWSRIWVVQEVVAFNAKMNGVLQTRIRCGSYEMLWSELVDACSNMLETDPKYGMPVVHARRIKNLEDVRIHLLNNPVSPSLLEVIRRYRSWQSTDPRDKIYALIGISWQPSNSTYRIKPDYKKRVNALLRDTVRATIEMTLKVNILCHCQERDSRAVSSWAPDWSTSLTYPILLDSEDDHSFDTDYGELEKSVAFTATGTTRAEVSFSDDLCCLRAKGILLDDVVYISEAFSFPDVYDIKNIMALAQMQQDVLENTYVQDRYIDTDERKYAFWNAVFAARANVREKCDTPMGKFNYQHWLPPIPQNWKPKFRQGLRPDDYKLVGLWAYGQFDIAIGPFNILSSLDAFPQYRCQKFAIPSLLTMKYLYNRRLFITSTGYIGLGPSSMKKGSSVVLLFGGDVPFVLQVKDDNPDQFELLGECYVYGIMNGEAVKNRLQPRWFDIV